MQKRICLDDQSGFINFIPASFIITNYTIAYKD